VEERCIGAATVVLMPMPASELDDRTFDVDPHAREDVVETLTLARDRGRKPLLEIDRTSLTDGDRAWLTTLGIAQRWSVAELRLDLASWSPMDAPMVAVRDVHPDEADAFGALAEEAFGQPPEGIPRLAPGEIRDAWAAYRRVGLAHCYLAELDQIPCAVGLSLRVGDLCLVDGAATLPAFRGRGAQLALLSQRFRDARDAGCRLALTRTAEASASQRNLARAGMHVARITEVWG
jgi:GNAT superfamily N-acetyltransferase